MTGTLTAYFNTGFNGVDIPATPSVLDTATKKVYPGVYYAREDIEKPYFDIADSYENLKNCDYVSYNNGTDTTYYFCVPTALAKGVTRLSLDLDALLTMGGASTLNYTSGWQERGHIAAADDTLFSNLASEDWMPTEPLKIAHTGKFGHKTPSVTQQDIDVVVSSVDLVTLGAQPDWSQDVINGVLNGTTDAVMYFPAIPLVQQGSTYSAYDFTDAQYKTFTIPASGAFNLNATNIPKALKKLYSAGQLQLQASYKIPGEYLSTATIIPANPGQYATLIGIEKELAANTMPYEYTIPNYTIKNKKCFTTYRQYVIANLGSSDSCIKAPEELYNGTDQYPTILLWADTSSTGKPYARFKYIKDNPIQYADAVKGLQWNTNQIMMEGASGSLWNSMNAAFQNSTYNRQIGAQSMAASYAAQGGALAGQIAQLQATKEDINAIAGATGGIGGALSGLFGGKNSGASIVGGAAGAVGDAMGQTMVQQLRDLQMQQIQNSVNQAQANAQNNIAQIQQSINENKVGLLKNNNIVSPSILFTPEQNLGLYGYNYFVLYEIRKSDEDLKSEDQYYQRFGYNGLHRPLTSQCFNERTYYNYVQAFNINIKSTYGLRVRAKAISQLNAGVRVWKVLPDASYYDIN